MTLIDQHPSVTTVRHAAPVEPDPRTRAFYVDALRALDRAGVEYLVGGGYAMAYYTGIARNTKDLDLFIRPEHRDRTLNVLSDAGYRTEFFYAFWIAKAIDPSTDAFIDLLYNSGNGLCPVDDGWFEHSIQAEVLGQPVRLVPPEEQLWSKAFVMDRDRFDGADVAHLIFAQGATMDWQRLLARFKGHERVLLAHVMLFGYAYPCERDRVPGSVIKQLERAAHRDRDPEEKICRGPNLAQKGYGVPLREWGYVDARLRPHGPLSRDEVAQLPEP